MPPAWWCSCDRSVVLNCTTLSFLNLVTVTDSATSSQEDMHVLQAKIYAVRIVKPKEALIVSMLIPITVTRRR